MKGVDGAQSFYMSTVVGRIVISISLCIHKLNILKYKILVSFNLATERMFCFFWQFLFLSFTWLVATGSAPFPVFIVSPCGCLSFYGFIVLS
jgi:hypothetical protein